MRDQNINFAYLVEDAVVMSQNQKAGKVIGLYVDRKNTQWYLVQYADNNGLISDKYCLAEELSSS